MPTLREIAAETGFSLATVSRALQPDGKVSDETRMKVMVAMQKLEEAEYEDDSIRETVGLIFAGSDNHFYDATIRIIDSKLRDRGYHLLCVISNDSVSTKSQMRRLCRLGVRAILLVGPSHTISAEALTEMSHMKIPVIQIFQKVYPGLDSVTVDDEGGMYSVGRTLLHSGHRRILYVGAREALHYEGFRRAFAEAGIDLPEESGLAGNCRNQTDTLRRVVEEMRPTAIVAHTEANTIDVLNVCKLLRKKVPEEISLCAYDDYPWLAMMDISAIFHPLEEVAEHVCDLLHLRLTEKTEEGEFRPIHLVAVPHLIARDSIRYCQTESKGENV